MKLENVKAEMIRDLSGKKETAVGEYSSKKKHKS